jgi:hypothetical protein
MSHRPALARVALVSAVLHIGTMAAVRADTYNWSYSNSGTGDSGSGVLVTGAADGNGFDITSMSGTWDGQSITNILAVGSYGENDNILFVNGLAPPTFALLLDGQGVSFDFGGSSSNRVNIFAPNSVQYGECTSALGMCVTGGTFTATLSVPGPIAGAGFPGLIVAGGGLLGWWRRKRQAQAAA